MENIIQSIIGVIVFVFLLIYVDQRGSNALGEIAEVGAILFFGLMLYEVVSSTRQRLHAETHRRLGIANQEHAHAEAELSKASRPITIAGVPHLVWTLKDGEYQAVPIPTPPIVTQSGDVITADEAKLIAAASRLVELSIASDKADEQGRTGNASNRIASADEADTKIGVKWQQVTDYMATRGWIRKDNKAGTWCINDTPNLAALRLAVAFAALPARQK